MDYSGNRSQIIDYRGQIIAEHIGAVDSLTAAPINIEALREYRVTALFPNWVNEMRIEQYSLIYKAVEAMGGIFPKNLCMDMLPMSKAEAIQLRRYITNKLVEMGIYTPPTDWKPYEVAKEVVERVKKAAARSA
jgi:hypothetical protein